MKIAFYAGSFDPFTTGHLHVVKRATKIFDKIVVGIGDNEEKKRRFEKNAMQEAIKRVMVSEKLENKVEVITYTGYTVEVALQKNSTFLVRGIRNETDYEYEEKVATTNERLSGIDTIYVRAGCLGNISSSKVMELLQKGEDVSKYLPKEILELVHNAP